MKIRRRHAAIVAVVLVVIDQLSKHWVEASLSFHEPVYLLPFLSWFRTWNEGIAFSFLTFVDERILALMSLVILFFIIWLWKHTPRYRWLLQIGFAFIVGGAIGNLLDRVFLGHVVDFILFHWGSWSFPVFNLADSFITIGAGLVIFEELFGSKVGAKTKI